MTYQMIRKEDSEYPTRLRSLSPFYDRVLKRDLEESEVLYIEGNHPELLQSQVTISIIGTRSPFHKAFEWGEFTGRAAATRGITVVSGYATGIDLSGHLGAMDENGWTIAVLGSGINVKHPSKPALERYILEHGIFVSEQQDPNTKRSYEPLMERNRLTASLSDAIFVIETGRDGGAVHTARIGHGHGKKVYTIEWRGSKYEQECKAGNAQLTSEGIGEAITSDDFEERVVDILEDLRRQKPS